MPPSAPTSRRDFLGVVSAASAGRLLWRENLNVASPAPPSDYLFAKGLIYFGTATLGPCPRHVVEETVRAWYELETNPSGMGYGDGSTLAAAEIVRVRAASLLG